MSDAGVSKTKPQRVAYIDNVKGVLITLVVLGHFWSNVLSYSSSSTALTIFNFIYSFHMPLFLFVSGLFAASSFKKGRGFQPQNVLLYLVLFLLFYLAGSVEGVMLGGGFSFDPFYVNSGCWYLLVLAGFSLITPVLAKMKFSWALALSLVLSVANGLFNEDPTFLSTSRFFTYLPWYVLGFYMTSGKLVELRNRVAEFCPKKRNLVMFAAFAFLVVYALVLYLVPDSVALFNRRLSTGLHPFYSLQKALYLPDMALVFIRVLHYVLTVLVCMAVLVLVPRGGSHLTVVGERSLQIYIFHLLFIYWYKTTAFDSQMLAISPLWVFVGPLVLGLVVTLVLSLPKSPNKAVKRLKKMCEVPFV